MYHNIPAWQWKPIMQLATGLAAALWGVALEGAAAHQRGLPLCSLRGPAGGSCACCSALPWLTCGRASYPAVLAATSTVAAAGAQAATRALFQPLHFAENWLTNCLVLARQRRFADDVRLDCRPLPGRRLR